MNLKSTLNAAHVQSHAAPKVAILLGTYQGQDHLPEQLDSFVFQTYSNWDLWASDDGSRDDTLAILKARQAEWGEDRLFILSGPRKGFAANFLSLTCNAAINADYFAYSDQDDIWEADKLQRAVDWLNTVPVDVPALYCTRTRLVDVAGGHIGYSPLFKKPPSFANALVQSLAGGNTMVFNQAARNLMCEAGEELDLVAHDWWAYMVVTACGGKVFYDQQPSVLYRQHGTNMVGENISWFAQIDRINKLFRSRFRSWNDRNVRAIQCIRPKMTLGNGMLFDAFSVARNDKFFPRLNGFMRSGVHRQTFMGNLGLVVAAFFKKI